jgi:hypothetical protein
MHFRLGGLVAGRWLRRVWPEREVGMQTIHAWRRYTPRVEICYELTIALVVL